MKNCGILTNAMSLVVYYVADQIATLKKVSSRIMIKNHVVFFFVKPKTWNDFTNNSLQVLIQ